MRRTWWSLPRVVRFFIVGGINTAFGYAFYSLLLFVGLHYAIAALLATVAGVLFNFVTTGTFVFSGMSRAGLVRFAGAYVITYGVNVALLALFAHAGLDPYLAGLACIVPMALVSYALLSHFVFGEPPWR